MIVLNDLYDYKNRYIYQDGEAFKFSLDSILLAEFASFKESNKRVLDLCTGNGAIPLIMSTYNHSQYVGFEIQKEIYDLGVKSVDYNKLDNINLINDDVNNISKYYEKSYFDIITCNPPFFKKNDEKVINQNSKKAVARHEINFVLEDAFKIAKDYLNDNGALLLVQRPERMDELFNYASKYHLNIKKIQLICTKENSKPSIILVKCVKNSKMGVVVNSQLNIQKINSYQNIFKEEK